MEQQGLDDAMHRLRNAERATAEAASNNNPVTFRENFLAKADSEFARAQSVLEAHVHAGKGGEHRYQGAAVLLSADEVKEALVLCLFERGESHMKIAFDHHELWDGSNTLVGRATGMTEALRRSCETSRSLALRLMEQASDVAAPLTSDFAREHLARLRENLRQLRSLELPAASAGLLGTVGDIRSKVESARTRDLTPAQAERNAKIVIVAMIALLFVIVVVALGAKGN